MTFFHKLKERKEKTKSHLCLGLDPDLEKIPPHLKGNLLHFCQELVESSKEHICSLKIQMAYFAGQARLGELFDLCRWLKKKHPDLPFILDAKRGDIGQTAKMYAKEVFEIYQADATTVNPYMGTDAIEPFTDFSDRGVFLLCRTSNPGAQDLQSLTVQEKAPFKLFEATAKLAYEKWNNKGNLGLVVGATAGDELSRVRQITGGEMPLLIPGIGAQGGSLQDVMDSGKKEDDDALLISASRSLIYASNQEDFAHVAAQAAMKLKDEINSFR